MQDFYYRKLLVYQHAMMLLEDVYHLTKKFPSSELHGLTNQYSVLRYLYLLTLQKAWDDSQSKIAFASSISVMVR